MTRYFYLICGAVMALVGGIISISPLPLGFLLFVPGMAFLILGSHKVAAWVRLRRSRNRELNAQVLKIADKARGPVAKALEKTDPHLTDPMDVTSRG